ncbi:unnamed protein product [Clavelina lepadiformis]|uniref:UDENN domain-containing protein n=1 Tax=Clavelina lepadiformis TaxID=159417 RepID=A0ABP0FBW2_CLALP
MALASLNAAGIVERDKNGGIMWVWSFPTFTDLQKDIAMKKCCLTWQTDKQMKNMDIIPFVYYQHSKLWFYILSTVTSEETAVKSVSHFSIILCGKDFNPEKYSALSRILSRCYDVSGNPVIILEQYLKVLTLGYCQSNNNGVFKVADFDIQKTYLAAKLKDFINMFGMESVLVYVAVVLKRRVVVFHDRIQALLDLIRAIPSLAWHQQDWSHLHPWVEDFSELEELPYFITGTTNLDLKSASENYDLFIDGTRETITLSPHAKDTFALGKIHKDIAKTMVDLASDIDSTNQDLIEAIDVKTQDIISKLRSLGGNEDRVSLEEIKSKKFNQTTENFLINLAIAERLIDS